MSSGSKIARCRSTSGALSRDPAFAPMFRWGLFGQARRICMCKSHRVGQGLQPCLISTILMALACPGALARELSITPATMAHIGTAQERFQSYNLESVEVIGGEFCKAHEFYSSDVQLYLYP